MPFFLALAAVGLFVLANRKKTPTTPSPEGTPPEVPGALPAPLTPKPSGTTVKPPLGDWIPDVISPPPAPITATVRGADGVLVATDTGRAIALAHLLHYGPVGVELSGIGTGVPGRTAAVSKRFPGTLGAAGVPPLAVSDTAVDWVRARLLDGQYVLLSTALFNPLATTDTLPAATSLLAVDPTSPKNSAVQLAPIMGPGHDWVLLGDPDTLGLQAMSWPASVDTFLTRIAG